MRWAMKAIPARRGSSLSGESILASPSECLTTYAYVTRIGTQSFVHKGNADRSDGCCVQRARQRTRRKPAHLPSGHSRVVDPLTVTVEPGVARMVPARAGSGVGNK
jgi:hypothetical protein